MPPLVKMCCNIFIHKSIVAAWDWSETCNDFAIGREEPYYPASPPKALTPVLGLEAPTGSACFPSQLSILSLRKRCITNIHVYSSSRFPMQLCIQYFRCGNTSTLYNDRFRMIFDDMQHTEGKFYCVMWNR